MKSQQKDVQQNKLLYALVIYDTPDGDSDIRKITNDVLNIDYPSDKLKIIINSYISPKKNVNDYVNLTNVIIKNFKHARLLLNKTDCNIPEIDFNAFSKCQNANYLVKMNIDQSIDKDYFNNINNITTEKGNDIIFCQNDITAIPYNIVSKNYLMFNDYNLMEKYLIEISKKNGSFKEIT
jgi:hypothetical protein